MHDSRILFVDDDPNVLAAFQRTFRKQFLFDTATSGVEALAMMKECGPYAVIVADMGVLLGLRVRLILGRGGAVAHLALRPGLDVI